MKTIRVVAAVIRDRDRIFATQRGYGEYKDGWEFPGGKIETGETSEQALVREIKEELETSVLVENLIRTVEYDYPEFHLSMDCFWCEVLRGDLILEEAQASRWLRKEELYSVPWLPADLTVIPRIAEQMGSGTQKQTDGSERRSQG
jgi:8-oxo-dGTP diphosphatase